MKTEKGAEIAEKNVWNQHANVFKPSNTETTVKRLPPAIYEYGENMFGWFLERIGTRFEFPYKIYGNHDHIVDRVQRAWNGLPTSLGILFNGLKGTGKTVTAQMLANWAIDHGLPVLVVSEPIKLADVLNALEQEVVVIFDEFEKTHEKPEEQQALLTTLDGMSRGLHRRLFLFTTNKRDVNENLFDRPGRIRYVWEFARLTDEVISALMDDLLDPEVAHLRGKTLAYLSTRSVLSIDAAKTAIQEVNIFREDPNNFEGVLNMSKRTPRGFKVEQIGDDGKPVKTLIKQLILDAGDSERLSNFITPGSERDEYVEMVEEYDEAYDFTDRWDEEGIRIVGTTEHPDVFRVAIKRNIYETWVKEYPALAGFARGKGIWVDAEPKEWQVPTWATKWGSGELDPDESRQATLWRAHNTLYGGEKPLETFVKVTPLYDVSWYGAGKVSLAGF